MDAQHYIDMMHARNAEQFLAGGTNDGPMGDADRRAKKPLPNLYFGEDNEDLSQQQSTASSNNDSDNNITTKRPSASDPLAYKHAIEYLTHRDINGMTPIDVYNVKQQVWIDAHTKWDNAQKEAKEQAALEFCDDRRAIAEAVGRWNQKHFREYKQHIQAAYMNWVAIKQEVEYQYDIVKAHNTTI